MLPNVANKLKSKYSVTNARRRMFLAWGTYITNSFEPGDMILCRLNTLAL